MRRPLLAIGAGLALAAAAPEAPTARRDGGPVLISAVEGTVTPVSVEHVRRTLERADRERCELVVFEMDTPGGLVESTELIVQSILASRAPVVVHVTPAGAQAASAGLYIANAADVIAMAPGTRMGAGHPVLASGPQPKEGDKGGRDILGEKIENDLAAGVRSIAMQRGRNAEVFERMVRQSISLTEREALEQKVADLVARDLEDLLDQLDGREIARFDGTRQVLRLGGARVIRFEMTPWQRLLSWLADPRIATVLFGIAMLGLYVEFNHPGLILPGVVGAAALILFGLSTQILPVTAIGLLLIALAVALFILEVKFTSYGLLTAGGVVSLTMGFLSLFDSEQMPSLRVPLSFILPTSLTVGAVMALVTWIVVRAHRGRVATGAEALAGEIGEAMTDLDPVGKVFVHGEYWNARARRTVARGRRVRIRAMRNMELDVEPTDNSVEDAR